MPRRRRMIGGGERGTRKWERGTALPATVPRSAFRVPTLAFSRGRSPLGVQIVLQQERGGEGVHIGLAASGAAAHLPYRTQHARGREALVPERDRQPGLPADGGGEIAGRSGGRPFLAPLVERQPHDHAGHGVRGEEVEQSAQGEALAGAAGEGRKRQEEDLGFVGKREDNTPFATAHPQQPPPGWTLGRSDGRTVRRLPVRRSDRPTVRHPCDIVAKNSVLVFVRLSRSSRNSIPSTGGMS